MGSLEGHFQEKNNSVWEATLKVANAADGRKIPYDVTKIKMLEGAITLAAQSSISTEGPRIIGTPSADANVTLTVEKNNPKIPEAAKAADRAVGIHVDDGTENAAPGTIDAIRRGFEPR